MMNTIDPTPTPGVLTAADPAREPLVLVTAEEAYPELENALLDARHSFVAGFRIFDLSTRLRGARARAVGADWFDLILDALQRGVSVRIVLSDFDPVVGEDLHAGTWRTLRLAAALAELAPDGAKLSVQAAQHPARLAWPVRLALWPKVQKMLGERAAEMRRMTGPERQQVLRDRPGLWDMFHLDGEAIRPRRFRLPDLKPVTHHQKIAVIDGEVVYCGGLDLDDRRFDTKRHEQSAEQTWHDVQVLVRDFALAEAATDHLDRFVRICAATEEPSPGPSGLLRTLSARSLWRLFAPNTIVAELEQAILNGIGTARRHIYLESQFLRDRRIARALRQAARRVPDLTLLLVLPAAPDDVAFENNTGSDARFGEFLQARRVRGVRRAFGSRCLIASPVRPVASRSSGRDSIYGSPQIYVHAKVCIFDDRLAIISSANLNGRSMRWDTEAGIALSVPSQVRGVHRRLLSHWLEGAEIKADPLDLSIDDWRRIARENARLPAEKRQGFLVPYLETPARKFGADLPGLPEELV